MVVLHKFYCIDTWVTKNGSVIASSSQVDGFIKLKKHGCSDEIIFTKSFVTLYILPKKQFSCLNSIRSSRHFDKSTQGKQSQMI